MRGEAPHAKMFFLRYAWRDRASTDCNEKLGIINYELLINLD